MIAQFLSLAFPFMVVLCRSAAAIMFLPGLGEDEPPAMLRAGLALAVAVLLTPLLAASLPAPPPDFMTLVALLCGEILVGGLIGWLARTLALALPAAGQLVSLMTGLSSVLQPDATLGAQSAAIGRLFNLLSPVLVLATGLYALPLEALSGSYGLFPAGVVVPSGDVVGAAVKSTAGSFALALRLASPFILMSVIWQVGLGLLSRLVPQIQIYFASLPGQVLGGLLLLALLSAGIARAWLEATRIGFSSLPGL